MRFAAYADAALAGGIAIMNIALVFPRVHRRSGDPPLGLGYLASNIDPEFRHRVSIIDGTFLRSLEDVNSLLQACRPGITGIYCDTVSYSNSIAIAASARASGSFVVAGGPHATVLPHTVIGYVDAVVLGEGERTFAEIVSRGDSFDLTGVKGVWFKQNGRVVANAPREPIKDLDSLNFPERGLFDMESYTSSWHYLDILGMRIRGTTVVASRGCPYRCTYCQPTLARMFGGKPRMRSPGNIVEEIQNLKDDYGIQGIFIHDDTLTSNRTWLCELCDHLIADDVNMLWACNTRADVKDERVFRKMHAAGLRYIHLGAESGSQRILDTIYCKNIKLDDIRETVAIAKKVGIRAGCFFMLGAPTETIREIKETIRFASSLDIDEATFNITSPLPGTFLHDKVRELRYKVSDDYSDFNYYSRRAFEDPNINSKALKYYQKKALISFYLRPRRWKYLLRHFTSPTGIKKIITKVRRFFG